MTPPADTETESVTMVTEPVDPETITIVKVGVEDVEVNEGQVKRRTKGWSNSFKSDVIVKYRFSFKT